MSKEKQIEEIFDIITTDCDGKCVGCEFENNEWCFTHYVSARLYNVGYRKQEWVSVEERLPEDEQTVLTIDTEGEMQVCFYETAWKGVFHQYHGLVMIYNITHWMPLPEAPKMKGGAE